jgi:hypothetical protein
MREKERRRRRRRIKHHTGNCLECDKPFQDISPEGKRINLCDKCFASFKRSITGYGVAVREMTQYFALCSSCRDIHGHSEMASRLDAEQELAAILNSPCRNCHKIGTMKLITALQRNEKENYRTAKESFESNKNRYKQNKEDATARFQFKVHDVAAADFLRKDNESLVKLLRVIRTEERGYHPKGLSTRRLCIRAFNSQRYGLLSIERAEKEGYITRTGDKTNQGGGRARIVKLTDKGRGLLKELYLYDT